MYAVLMGIRQLRLQTAVVVRRRYRVMVFEKPEVIDKTDQALSGT